MAMLVTAWLFGITVCWAWKGVEESTGWWWWVEQKIQKYIFFLSLYEST